MQHKISNQEKKMLEQILADLTKPTSKKWQIGYDSIFSVVKISSTVPDANLLKYILSDVLDFPCDYMPMEKVLWEIGFTYNGMLCKVTSEKFGHRLYIETKDGKDVPGDVETLIKLLNSATTFTKPILSAYAETEIKKGEVVIDNQFSELLSMYEYFRDLARQTRNAKIAQKKDTDALTQSWNAEITEKRHAAYYEEAAYFSFFGLLEHLLVLMVAFKNFDPNADYLKNFVHKPWSVKYDRIFDRQTEKDVSLFYDQFWEIAKRYRNPRAHGMLNKDGRSMGFYLEGTGILSADFSENSQRRHWDWMHMDGSALDTMDTFLVWVRNHPLYKVPMQIIDGGLSIDFSGKGQKQYETLIKQGDATDFIEEKNVILDQRDNMDW